MGQRPTTSQRNIAIGAWIAAWALLVSATCPAPNEVWKYGVNVFDSAAPDQATRDAIKDSILNAGFRWTRIFILWDQIHPNDPSSANAQWSFTDSLVTEAFVKGFSILAVVKGTPTWAIDMAAARTSCPGDSPGAHWPPYQGDFGSFTRELVNHTVTINGTTLAYGNIIAAWELWNEPEDCTKWRGTKGVYRDRILTEGYDGIKGAGYPVAIVMAPAILATGNFSSWLTGSTGKLIRPIDSYSFHVFNTPTTVDSNIKTANSWNGCCGANDPNCPANYCVGSWWLTAFGFSSSGSSGDACDSSHASSPGDEDVNIIRRIDNGAQGYKKGGRSFLFTSSDWRYCHDVNCDNPCNMPTFGVTCNGTGVPSCDLGLLQTTNTPRTKFCTLACYMRPQESLSPANASACGSCP